MKPLRERVRDKIEAKRQGIVSDEKTHEDDPLSIKDNDQEGEFFGSMVTTEEEFDGKLPGGDEVSKPPKKEKETTDVGNIEGTDDEAPPEKKAASKVSKGDPAEVETVIPESTESEGTPAIGATGKPSATPTGKVRVKTVYGEEDLSHDELAAGYMRNAHYTQVQQIVRHQEALIKDLLSNPEKLVQFAMDNGVDLKPLVSPEPIIQKVKLPPLPEYPTEQQVAERAVLETVLQNSERMAAKLAASEAAELRKGRSSDNDEVERNFKELRGELPEIAAGAVYSIYKRGQMMFGKVYTVKNAIDDYKISEGDIYTRVFNSQKGQQYIDQKIREGIAAYHAKKTAQSEDHLAPDSLGSAGVRVPERTAPKPKTWEDWKDAAKRSVGVKPK